MQKGVPRTRRIRCEAAPCAFGWELALLFLSTNGSRAAGLAPAGGDGPEWSHLLSAALFEEVGLAGLALVASLALLGWLFYRLQVARQTIQEQAKRSEEMTRSLSQAETDLRSAQAALQEAQAANQRVLQSETDRRHQTEQSERKLGAQLRQAQRMEAFGHLATGVAHDFNNLLTVIRGNVTLLQLQETSGVNRVEALRAIGESAKRAADLTRQLLAFSRRNVVQRRDVDLNTVVGNITRLLQRMIGEHITLEARCVAGALRVQADPGLLEQALMVLAVQARAAMPKGGRLILETACVTLAEDQCAGQPKRRAGRFARLSVRDTGSTPSPEDLRRLSEAASTAKEAEGSNLGLPSPADIAAQHQGWVEVESDAGAGTTFHLYLPSLAESPGRHEEPPSVSELPRGTETILLVEDDPSLRLMAKRMLERQGYRVTEARSGMVALNVWAEQRTAIDLLLTDVVMPEGLSGPDLAERLLSEKPSLKVLFTSGYSEELAGRGFALPAGANLLEKPYDADKLLHTVRACLDALPGR